MYTEQKYAMKAISQYAGARLDFVQGGGGNTSYKFDDTLMAIKASGYSLLEVEENKGYVTVDYSAIKESYAQLAQKTDVDVEKQTLDINMNSVSLLPGMENKRPSVEVGFHSYLKRAVVHTHSVYSNLLCCSVRGEEIAKEIFGGSDLGYIYIPFISPGFRLSLFIRDRAEEYCTAHGKYPDLIFMESHGIIVSNDDYLLAMRIHDTANDMIAKHFGAAEFPQPDIVASDDGFVSDTPFIKAFIKKYGAGDRYFDTTILYPDQLVYLGSNLGDTIRIDEKEGTVKYLMSETGAKVIEEIILGVAYIICEIDRAGQKLKLLSDEGIDFIRNWESEKYRSKLVK